jgi:hypothetical protein
VASKTPKKDYESAKQKIADEYKGKSMKPVAKRAKNKGRKA